MDLSPLTHLATLILERGLRCAKYFKVGLFHVLYGVGDQIQFYIDFWIGDQSLVIAFPSSFQIASNPSFSRFVVLDDS